MDEHLQSNKDDTSWGERETVKWLHHLETNNYDWNISVPIIWATEDEILSLLFNLEWLLWEPWRCKKGNGSSAEQLNDCALEDPPGRRLIPWGNTGHCYCCDRTRFIGTRWEKFSLAAASAPRSQPPFSMEDLQTKAHVKICTRVYTQTDKHHFHIDCWTRKGRGGQKNPS